MLIYNRSESKKFNDKILNLRINTGKSTWTTYFNNLEIRIMIIQKQQKLPDRIVTFCFEYTETKKSDQQMCHFRSRYFLQRASTKGMQVFKLYNDYN